MAVTINASTSAGLISTADTSGILQLQTANTTALTITAAQNVGIGTASPAFSNFSSASNGIEIKSASTFGILRLGGTNGQFYLASGDAGGTAWLWNYTNSAMVFATNNTERMRLDSSGNLGLGVTPSAWSSITALQIKNGFIGGLNNRVYVGANNYFEGSNNRYIATDFATRYYQNAGQHIWETAPSGTAGNAISFTQAMTLDASGNLGVGTTSPSQRIHASAADPRALLASTGTGHSAWQCQNTSGSSYFGRDNAGGSFFGTSNATVVYSSSADPIIFYTNATERARIDSSGNLLVGKTTTADTTVGFSVIGAGGTQAGCVTSTLSGNTNTNTTMQVYSTGAGAYRFYVGMAGTIFATSTSISAISDQRLKENVRDLDTGLDSIMALQPRRFDWKEGKGQDKKDVAGFIAQEFETVFPECVGTSKAGEDGIEYKNINHETLIPTLVKAIQEQQTLIQSLKARLDAANL